MSKLKPGKTNNFYFSIDLIEYALSLSKQHRPEPKIIFIHLNHQLAQIYASRKICQAVDLLRTLSIGSAFKKTMFWTLRLPELTKVVYMGTWL